MVNGDVAGVGRASTIGDLPQPARPSAARTRTLARVTTIVLLEALELLFVRTRKLVAEQFAEAGVRVLDDAMDFLPVHFPVTHLRRHGDQRALARLLIELRLEAIGIELREHRLERRAHAGEYRYLMITNVVEGVFERPDRLEVRRIALDQQVVERVVHVGRELERVVLLRLERGRAHPELLLDALPCLEHVHHARDDDAENLTEAARELGRRRDVPDARVAQDGAEHHVLAVGGWSGRAPRWRRGPRGRRRWCRPRRRGNRGGRGGGGGRGRAAAPVVGGGGGGRRRG